MTRHPKKKEHEKKSGSTDPNVKDVPAPDSSTDQTDAIKTKKPLDKLFWIRVALGVIAGIIAAQIGNSMDMELRPFVGFGIMIFLFMISYGIAKAMRIPLLASEKKKLVMTGIGSYFFMFIFSWILVFTLMHSGVIDLSPVR